MGAVAIHHGIQYSIIPGSHFGLLPSSSVHGMTGLGDIFV